MSESASVNGVSLKGKRKVKLSKCPNPLFEHWLKEWKDDAASKNMKTQYVYAKALASLKKYPLPLTAKECRLLENFGDKTCKMLEEKYAQYVAEYGTTDVVPGYLPVGGSRHASHRRPATDSSLDSLQFDNLSVPPPRQVHKGVEVNAETAIPQQRNNSVGRQRRRSEREYIPQFRSGAYAILLTLFKNNVGSGYLSKRDLLHEAQPLADKSFTMPDPGSRYTAWSSMGTLIKRGLVVKESNPAKYRLTAGGEALAGRILEAERNGNIGNQDRSTDEQNLRFVIDDGTPENVAMETEMDIEDVPLVTPPAANSITQFRKDMTGTKDKKNVLSDEVNKLKTYSLKGSSSNTKSTSKQSYGVKSADLPQLISSSPHSRSKKTRGFSDLEDQTLVRSSSVLGGLTRGHSYEKCSSTSTSCSSEVPSLCSQSEDSQKETFTMATLIPNCVLIPGLFEVILCVDNSEVYGNASDKMRQVIVSELERHKVPHTVRPLNVGDFCWIARDKINHTQELILDYIVERKRMDDLAGSIIDGRFKEQKFRLKNCGITRPVYLVEDYGSTQHFSIGEDALMQAITNTQIADGFHVKRTSGTKESAAYLTLLTRYIQSMYINKTLNGVSKSQIQDIHKACSNDKEAYLMSFDEFNRLSVKSKTLTVREMFGKQLCQLRGMTGEKAVAILNKYPTVSNLLHAYMNCPITSDKERLLANIKFGPLQKNIGNALSKSVYYLYNIRGSDI